MYGLNVLTNGIRHNNSISYSLLLFIYNKNEVLNLTQPIEVIILFALHVITHAEDVFVTFFYIHHTLHYNVLESHLHSS